LKSSNLDPFHSYLVEDYDLINGGVGRYSMSVP
jgi:hypothetical protein